MPKIDQVASMATDQLLAKSNGGKQTEDQSSLDFPSLVEKGIDRLNSKMSQADRLAAELAAGKELDIPQVMIAISKADISFKMFVQMRNKALSAYEEIMRLQF